MNQSNGSRKWIWVVLVVVILMICCCLVMVTAGYFYYKNNPGFLNQIIEQPSVENTIPEIAAATQELIVLPTETSIENPEPQVTEAPHINSSAKIILSNESGVWTLDATTLEFEKISSFQIQNFFHLEDGYSPGREFYAYISGFGGASIMPQLFVLDINQNKIFLQMDLTGPDSQVTPLVQIGDPAFEASRAMQYQNSLAWSPDGKKLAFVGAMDGPTADLYLFNLDTGSIERLSDENFNVADIHWSPDGQSIIYLTVESFGTGAGLGMDSLWVYDLVSNQSGKLEDVTSGGEEFMGWYSPHEFLMHSWNAACEAYNLRRIDIQTGFEDELLGGCFSAFAFNPDNRTGMVSVQQFNQEFCNCGEPITMGLYWFENGNINKISSEVVYSISFMSPGNIFVLNSENGTRIYGSDGLEIEVPGQLSNARPYPAREGGYWAWIPNPASSIVNGLWVTKGNSNPVQVTEMLTGQVTWNETGDVLFYELNGVVYSASAPDFTPELLIELAGGAFDIVP